MDRILLRGIRLWSLLAMAGAWLWCGFEIWLQYRAWSYWAGPRSQWIANLIRQHLTSPVYLFGHAALVWTVTLVAERYVKVGAVGMKRNPERAIEVGSGAETNKARAA